MNEQTREMQNRLIDYAESKPGWEVTETVAEEDEDFDENDVLRVEVVVERVVTDDDNDYQHDDEKVFE